MSETANAWMEILQKHAEGALLQYHDVIERSAAANKQAHDPPTIALSVAEHVDMAAFVIVGVCPTAVAVEDVRRHFKAALDSYLKTSTTKAEG